MRLLLCLILVVAVSCTISKSSSSSKHHSKPPPISQPGKSAATLLFEQTCYNNSCAECNDTNTTRGAFCVNACPNDPYRGCKGVRWNGEHLVSQPDCCSDEEILDFGPAYRLGGVVLVRQNGTSGNSSVYLKFVVNPPRMLAFPGLDAVLTDPHNMYTNYTCDSRCCKMAIVDRSFLGCVDGEHQRLADGTCIYRGRTADYDLNLCHNSTDDWCAIWEPCALESHQSTEFIVVLVLMNFIFLGIMIAVVILVDGRCNEFYEGLFLSCVAVVVMAVVCVFFNFCIVVPYFLEIWKDETQVSSDYIAYQGCMEYCGDVYKTGHSPQDTVYNQCGDQPVEMCDGFYWFYCRSCRSNIYEWDDLSFLSSFMRGSVYAEVSLYVVVLCMVWLMRPFFALSKMTRGVYGICALFSGIGLIALMIYRIYILSRVQFLYTELNVLEYSWPMRKRTIFTLYAVGVVVDFGLALGLFAVSGVLLDGIQ